MQTLSLKTSQSAQKNLTDVASKNDSNVNNLAADAEKTPFHMALTKQIQAKKPTSQPSHATHPAQNKVAQNAQTAAQQAKEKRDLSAEVAEASAEKVTNPDKVSQVDSVEMLLGLQTSVKLDDTKLASEFKEQKEIRAEDVAINQDRNIATLAGLFIPVSNANVTGEVASNTDEQNTLLSESSLQSQTTSTGVSSSQKSLDTLLGNALSQSQRGNSTTPDKDAADNPAGQSSDQARWIDEILETPQTKLVSGDIAANKNMTNALSDAAADKQAVTMTSALPQSQLAQVNGALAAQQAANTNTISAYPGKAGWDQAISQKVVWMVGAGEQTASLTLNPPDLGPLKVVIHVHNDQADTTFISDNDEVRQALENGLSNLRDKMNESGIQLGQTNVSTSSQSQQNFQQAAQNRLSSQTQNVVNAAEVEAVANTRAPVRVTNGLVDTFA